MKYFFFFFFNNCITYKFFFRCYEKDTLEGTLKKCFSLKEFPVKDSKGQGIIINFKLLQADLKQVFLQIDNFYYLIFNNYDKCN